MYFRKVLYTEYALRTSRPPLVEWTWILIYIYIIIDRWQFIIFKSEILWWDKQLGWSKSCQCKINLQTKVLNHIMLKGSFIPQWNRISYKMSHYRLEVQNACVSDNIVRCHIVSGLFAFRKGAPPPRQNNIFLLFHTVIQLLMHFWCWQKCCLIMYEQFTHYT